MFSKKNNHKIDSKEVGLDIGLRIFKFFLKTEYLHYGYFIEGLEADVTNLKKAQENYAELLFSHIPEGTKTILDVGCGSGKTAQQLVARGYQVDCVSPNPQLTAYAKKLEGVDDRVTFFQCKFEDMPMDKKYDLILFSESFQYISLEKSIPQALALLNPAGYIMVSDFFKDDPERKSTLGGGHTYDTWLEYKSSYPIKVVVEKDITAETAPTIDIVNQLSTEVLKPIWTSVWALGEDRFPYVIKLARMIYPRKINKIMNKMENKFFTGQQNGENFKKYKRYMFYLFQAIK